MGLKILVSGKPLFPYVLVPWLHVRSVEIVHIEPPLPGLFNFALIPMSTGYEMGVGSEFDPSYDNRTLQLQAI